MSSSSSHNSDGFNTNTSSGVQTGSAASLTPSQFTSPPSNSYRESSHRLPQQAPITYRHVSLHRGPRPIYRHGPPVPNNWHVAHGRPHGPRPLGGYYNTPVPMECAWGGYPVFDHSARIPLPQQPMFGLGDKILKQVDYYFSEENLVKDTFLRLQMDEYGWVPISLIASFPRIKQMTTYIPAILASLRHSTTVELQGEKVRKRKEWSKWLLPSIRHVRN